MMKRHFGLALATTFGALVIGGIAAQQNTTQAFGIPYYFANNDTQIGGVAGLCGEVHAGESTFIDEDSGAKIASNTVTDATSGITHYQEVGYHVGLFHSGTVYSAYSWADTNNDQQQTTPSQPEAQTSEVDVQYLDGDNNNAVLYTQPWTGTPGSTLTADQYNDYQSTMAVFKAEGKTVASNNVPAAANQIVFPAANQHTTYQVVIASEQWTTYAPATEYMADMEHTVQRRITRSIMNGASRTVARPVVEGATFDRNYYVSTVAAHSHYGEWAPTTGTIPSLPIEQIDGYQSYILNADGTYTKTTVVPAATVTPNSADLPDVEVYYFADGVTPRSE